MIPTEKLDALNKLIKDLDIKGNTNEEKLFLAVTDALNEMAEILQSCDAAIDGLTEVLSDVEESVYELEDEVFNESGSVSELGEYDDDIYDITCASCDKTITVDYDALGSGSVTCPGCGSLIEFTIEFEE